MSLALGLDPGYGRLGWGVARQEGSRLIALAYGVIETPAKAPFERRLEAVYDGVASLCMEHGIREAAVETLFFSKNAKTAMQVAEARGVIRLALVKSGVEAVEVSPNAVKLALTGDGKADKGQVTRMVTRLLGLKSAPKPDDAADALALALTCLRTRPLRRMQARAKRKS